MATLGMLFHTHGLPKLKVLLLHDNRFGDAGLITLCAGLIRATLRGVTCSLEVLGLSFNHVGPAGAEALSAALSRGALPHLQRLNLNNNPLGNQGITALAPALRKQRALCDVDLMACNISDKGVAAMCAGLVKGDFGLLHMVDLTNNKVTEQGCASLLSCLEQGWLPSLYSVHLELNPGLRTADGEHPAVAALNAFLHRSTRFELVA